MYWQDTITEAALYTPGGHLNTKLSECNQGTITDAAFVHLAGIHTLIM